MFYNQSQKNKNNFLAFDYRKPAESRKKSEIPHVYGNRDKRLDAIGYGFILL